MVEMMRGSRTETSDADSAKRPLIRAGLRTPQAAAIAGIPFSLLLLNSLWLLRPSVPSDRLDVDK
jgi:hypothetical protein